MNRYIISLLLLAVAAYAQGPVRGFPGLRCSRTKYSYTVDRTKYMERNNGQFLLRDCPTGTIFHPVLCGCSHPSHVFPASKTQPQIGPMSSSSTDTQKLMDQLLQAQMMIKMMQNQNAVQQQQQQQQQMQPQGLFGNFDPFEFYLLNELVF